jgi:hypothetical protein
VITQLVPHVLAHGIGGVQDLPVPKWLFFWGGAFVLVVSFIALGALWKTPQLERRSGGRDLGEGFGRIVLGPVRIVVQALSAILFVVILAAALFGTTDPFGNIAPTWVYVIFWVGVPVLSVLLGNVWRALSPWRAIADGFVWVWERLLGREARPLAAYPEGLGRYPGSVALFAFVALELCYSNPSNPRALAFAIALYSYVALFGMLAFGRDTWMRSGEGFAILFAYIGRIAPLVVREGRIRLRAPLAGLAGAESTPGSVLFLAVALGSVGFDGFSRTITWQDLVARVEAPYVLNRPGTGELLVTGLNLLGLLAAIAIVLGAFVSACAISRSMVTAPRSLTPDFVLSLVPIALVYAIAHYFSLFVIQGQYAIPLISDPFGKGWDLLGTAGFRPDIAILGPNTIWYVQVAALVLGHMAGLAVAHDRAVSIFRDRQDALRSQFPMLALMVVYTVGGLWLLSHK